MDIKDLPYKAQEAYPDVKGIQGNQKDVTLLSKAFSSCGSETTAILQYIFQHYVIEDEAIADVIRRIAITEMTHHALLGETINNIGGTPYYTNGFGGDYTTRCVFEGKNLNELLVQNIKDEKAAVAYYESIKPQLSNERLVALIDRIILDELIHIDTFNKLLEYVDFYKDN